MGGYGFGYFPPTIHAEGLLEYTCAHSLLRAHARVWHVCDKEFRPTQKGNISIVLDTAAYVPASNSQEDKIAADTKFHFELGWFANPLHFGDYPGIMKNQSSRTQQRRRKEPITATRIH
uniref:Beta-klotho-like n=1 Tax=Diabrotica virgifera virgifera TaxID=50390 RepID=A0A6P7GIE0_DIAVI